MTCCDKNSCKVTPQFCVDASVFVPEDTCLCYATAILFNNATLESTWDSELPENQLSTLAVAPETIEYTGNLMFGTDVVANINLTASNSDDLTEIVVSPPTITGLVVAFGEPSVFFEVNDPQSCYVSTFFGEGNFALTPVAGNPPLTFSDNASSPQGPYVYNIRFFGVVVGQFQFSLFQPTATTWSFTDLVIDNLVSYPGSSESSPPFNNDAVTVTCFNETEADCCNTIAENIGAASLVLNLKANNNVIGPCDGNKGDNLKRGIYKLCLAFKPWNLGCGCFDWEIREIVEFVLCDEKLKAYWGCSTSKGGLRIKSCEDRATLTSGNLEIQSVGNPCDVFQNTNDFVLTIRNVFQTFSVVGPFGSTDSLVVTNILDAPVPYSPTTLVTNDAVSNLVAKLANSKLYVTLKFECPNSKPYCTDPQCLDDVKKRNKSNDKNCCEGSLNPFGHNKHRSDDKCEVTSVFLNKELTNLQDHLFQNSHSSREIIVCLTPDCLNKVNCPKQCEVKKCCEVKKWCEMKKPEKCCEKKGSKKCCEKKSVKKCCDKKPVKKCCDKKFGPKKCCSNSSSDDDETASSISQTTASTSTCTTSTGSTSTGTTASTASTAPTCTTSTASSAPTCTTASSASSSSASTKSSSTCSSSTKSTATWSSTDSSSSSSSCGKCKKSSCNCEKKCCDEKPRQPFCCRNPDNRPGRPFVLFHRG